MTKSPKKSPRNFYCNECHYTTSSTKDYNRHLVTRKHKMMTNDDINDDAKIPKKFICSCGRKYKYRQGLHTHKKKCNYDEKIIEPKSYKKDIGDQSHFIEYLIQENSEMKAIVHEMQTKNNNTTNNINNTTNNINNQQVFNFSVFLNEKCKDAMNLTEFMDSMQLSIEDILKIGELGQTSGFANIFIDKLNAIDIFKRPLHCSDVKRETLYIKNNDEWKKEPDDRPQLKDVINEISFKGVQSFPDIDLPNETVTKTIQEVVNTPVNHKKIISKIAREVHVPSKHKII